MKHTEETRRYFVSSLTNEVIDLTSIKSNTGRSQKDDIEAKIVRYFDRTSGNVSMIRSDFSLAYGVKQSLKFTVHGDHRPEKDRSKSVVYFDVNMPHASQFDAINSNGVFSTIKKGLAVCEHLVSKLAIELEPEAKRQTGILLNENRIRAQWESHVLSLKPSPEDVTNEPKNYADMVGRTIWEPGRGIGVVMSANHRERVLSVKWTNENMPKTMRKYLVGRVSYVQRKNCLWIKPKNGAGR
jgi:hypothetical protein